jgi:hypothetical protein
VTFVQMDHSQISVIATVILIKIIVVVMCTILIWAVIVRF